MCMCNLKCNQLCKMQNESLRYAIEALRNNLNNSTSEYILKILEAIYNLLATYSCLPSTCLLERVDWVYKNIGKDYNLSASEKIKIRMIIAELEMFLTLTNS